MEDNINKELFWNKAAVAGLALGGVAIAYLFITQLFKPGIFSSMIMFVLWFAKFIGCIWLMKWFMLSYVNADPAAERKHAFRFGALAAFLSALIFSAAVLADTAFLRPELYREAANTAVEMQSGIAGADTSAMMLMIQKLPQYMFIFYLIIYTIYGTILSLIISRSLVADDPFRDTPSRNSNSGNDGSSDGNIDDQSSNE